MKKFFLSFSVIALFSWYVMGTLANGASNAASDVVAAANKDSATNPAPQASGNDIAFSPNIPDPAPTVARNPDPKPAPAPAQTSTPPPVPVRRGQYADGEYIGNPSDAYYGSVQVKAVIKNGKLADVQFLSWPNDRSHSIDINNYARPTLKSEAIQAQSANVDVVSGATDTSLAFMDSLGSALVQAKN